MTRRFRLHGSLVLVFQLACGGNPAPGAPAPEVTAPVESPPATVAEALSDARVLALGREYTALLHAREHDRLWQHLSPEAKARFGSAVELRNGIDRIFEELGDEQSVVRESVELPRPGMLADRVYLRIARYAGRANGPVRVMIGVRNDGSVVGMQVRPAE